jgi:tripartite-type tricarboxylate transporter receptor subunit TctC
MNSNQTSNARRIARLALAVVLAAPLAAPLVALAQTFPSKPVRIVVSYPPGGPVDALARPLAEGLSKLWNGNPVLVENRPGANAIIGTDYVAKQPGDGHTLLFANDPSLSSNQYLYSKLPYDPVKDFVPVAGVASTTLVLLVPPAGPGNFQQLVANAKAQPGKLSYASIGPGSVTHLDAEAMATAAGIKLVHVPYKGTGEVVPALLASQIDMTLTAIGPSLGHIRAGKLKALAIASAQRSPILPDVPTFTEAGLAGFEARSWFALAAPAGTQDRRRGRVPRQVHHRHGPRPVPARPGPIRGVPRARPPKVRAAREERERPPRLKIGVRYEFPHACNSQRSGDPPWPFSASIASPTASRTSRRAASSSSTGACSSCARTRAASTSSR